MLKFTTWLTRLLRTDADLFRALQEHKWEPALPPKLELIAPGTWTVEMRELTTENIAAFLITLHSKPLRKRVLKFHRDDLWELVESRLTH